MSVIDWDKVWKLSLLASREGRLENGYVKEEVAERYDRSEAIWRDGEKRAAALEIDPSWSVLDIGAGPGTLALPLVRRAKRVTAVEPSPAMVERLKRHIDEDGISNIRESLGLSYRERDDVIREYLEGRVRREGSKVMLEDDTTYVRISWKPSGR